MGSKSPLELLQAPLRSCELLRWDRAPRPACSSLYDCSGTELTSIMPTLVQPFVSTLTQLIRHIMSMSAHEMNSFAEPSSLDSADELAHLLRINVLLFAVLCQHAHHGLSVTTLRLQYLYISQPETCQLWTCLWIARQALEPSVKHQRVVMPYMHSTPAWNPYLLSVRS
jgi:hypothetical protein